MQELDPENRSPDPPVRKVLGVRRYTSLTRYRMDPVASANASTCVCDIEDLRLRVFILSISIWNGNEQSISRQGSPIDLASFVRS